MRHVGVYFDKSKIGNAPWATKFRGPDGSNIHIGLFDTEEEAAHAYDEAAVEHFKEAAILNFPSGTSSGGGELRHPSIHELGGVAGNTQIDVVTSCPMPYQFCLLR